MGDRLAQVIRVTDGALNALNEPAQVETLAGRIFVRRVDLEDRDRIEAGAETSEALAAFVMRDNTLSAAIAANDILRIAGTDWQVRGNTEMAQGRRARRRIVARRVVPA